MQYLKVRNFEKFQHYKDRRPIWIKLWRDLWNDPRFFELSEQERYFLISLFVVASQNDNKIPCDQRWLKRELATTKTIPVGRLMDLGWLEECDGSEKPIRADWPSRYVSDEQRERILKRDGHCVSCGSTKNLEIDHKVPVSKGGRGVDENLQALCRSCNRKKRSRTWEPAQPDATQTVRTSYTEPTFLLRSPRARSRDEEKDKDEEEEKEGVRPDSSKSTQVAVENPVSRTDERTDGILKPGISTPEMQKFWAPVEGYIRKQIVPESFDAFYAGCQLVGMNHRQVILAVPATLIQRNQTAEITAKLLTHTIEKAGTGLLRGRALLVIPLPVNGTA